MKRSAAFSTALLMISVAAAAQEGKPSAEPRHLTLQEAVQLAMKHNHVLRIAAEKVEEHKHTQEIARSAYYPLLRNDSNLLQLTDTQYIGIPQAGLGTVNGEPIPARSIILNQGGHTLITSGTGLTQPLTQLWRVRSANDVAAAELRATRDKARDEENQVALRVHQLYYRLLITQTHRLAAQAKVKASEDMRSEKLAQVKFGSALEEEAIESRAQALEAKQDLLTTELQFSDLTMQLNDAIGLPLGTQLALEPDLQQTADLCEREQCVKEAIANHPEIAEARAEVDKASAAVRLAQRAYIPDVEAFARYSYQDNVPFLVHNFGSFGIHFGYDLFDGGRRNAAIGVGKSQFAQAEENLKRIQDEVELRVQTSLNKLERTRQMVQVSQDLLAVRTEARRVSAQQFDQGAALKSQVDTAEARELEAKTLLQQAQLDYVLAQDDVAEAIGRRP